LKYIPKVIATGDASGFEKQLQELAEKGYKVTHYAAALTTARQGELLELYTAIMEKED
jgi:hypothetical protein